MAEAILIIDDESSIRRFLSRFLLRHGFEVDEAEDAYTALEKIGHRDYGVIITDLSMPGMNGLEMLDHIRGIETPKIVLTGAGTHQDALDAIERGAFEYVQKPINDLDAFLVTLRRAIEVKHLVTEKKRVVERLAQAERMSGLGQIVASVAHEIRNPLVSIGGYARRIAKTTPESSSISNYARIIFEETQRLERIVRDILDYANLSQPAFEEIRLAECFHNAARLYLPQVERKGVAFINNLQPETTVFVDGQQLEQVFINLIQNSLDAMPQGGVIQIWDEDAMDGILVRFSDTGQGIPDGVEMGELFKPFYTTKPHGTGLGLAVSFRIIQNHKGNIEIEKTGPDGTTFLLQLPKVGQLKPSLDRMLQVAAVHESNPGAR